MLDRLRELPKLIEAVVRLTKRQAVLRSRNDWRRRRRSPDGPSSERGLAQTTAAINRTARQARMTLTSKRFRTAPRCSRAPPRSKATSLGPGMTS